MTQFYHESESPARETDAEPFLPPDPAFTQWIEAFSALARQQDRDPHQLTMADLLRLYCLRISVARAVSLLTQAPPPQRAVR